MEAPLSDSVMAMAVLVDFGWPQASQCQRHVESWVSDCPDYASSCISRRTREVPEDLHFHLVMLRLSRSTAEGLGKHVL